MQLFTPLNLRRQARMLANHMPIGRVWSSVFEEDTNLGKLVKGLSVEFYRLQLQTENISNEFNLNKVNELIAEWEKSVGIPDTCFSSNNSLEIRRKQVLAKFSNYSGVQTDADFIRVAALFGYVIEIEHPGPANTMTVKIISYPDSEVGFPLEFPIPFTSGGTSLLQCIFNSLAPATDEVVFVPE